MRRECRRRGGPFHVTSLRSTREHPAVGGRPWEATDRLRKRITPPLFVRQARHHRGTGSSGRSLVESGLAAGQPCSVPSLTFTRPLPSLVPTSLRAGRPAKLAPGSSRLSTRNLLGEKKKEGAGFHSPRGSFPSPSTRMDLIAPRIQAIVPARQEECRGCQKGQRPSHHSPSHAENPVEKAPRNCSPGRAG
jgi:hypothetical protein